MQGVHWPYPGSRWWKFDFHNYTPASQDTPWHKQSLNLSPQDWLLRYMAAEIDCVAITDHNSGAWVDQLKSAYAEMQSVAAQGQAPAGFRELTLFPGVEISVQGGIHILALFDPSKSTSDIDTLLGNVCYTGTKGDSNGVTTKGIAEVIQCILNSGAIPIPAHADKPKGLLQCKEGTKISVLDANTNDNTNDNTNASGNSNESAGVSNWPQCVAQHEKRLPRCWAAIPTVFKGKRYQAVLTPG
ncbi:MAG: hypothetical protein HC848_09920 [Limnobacter sp.]|nr:hypothetical protein [Limnobacter sp.]